MKAEKKHARRLLSFHSSSFRLPPSRVLAAHTLLVYAFLYAPIVVLVIFSFNRGRQVGLWRGFSPTWYFALLRDGQMQEAALNSLAVAASATLISTVVGTMAAVALSRTPARSRAAAGVAGATRGLLYLPVILPEVVLGVALLTSFALARFRLGMTTVVLSHVVFTVSYVAVVVRARLAGLDRSLEEAAADLGAGPVGTFVRVTLPLIAPGIGAAGLLVFTISLDDYVVTSLVAGPNSTTLPVRIYSMLRTDVTPEVNAVCTVLLGLTVVLIVAAQWLMGRGEATAAPTL